MLLLGLVNIKMPYRYLIPVEAILSGDDVAPHAPQSPVLEVLADEKYRPDDFPAPYTLRLTYPRELTNFEATGLVSQGYAP